jgi:hypothetical protein
MSLSFYDDPFDNKHFEGNTYTTMIIWTGWGFLAALVPFVTSLVTELVVEGATGSDTSYQDSKMPLFIALILSALIVYVVERKVRVADRIVEDVKTKERLTVARKNSLFFIDLRYWPYIIAGISIVWLVFS